MKKVVLKVDIDHVSDLLLLWNQVWLKDFVKSPQYWNFIYQTYKNFGGLVSAKNFSDDIFTHKNDSSTPESLFLLTKIFCVTFFWKMSIVLPPLFFAI